MDDELLFGVENGVATIAINRPDKRNSFTDQMIDRWVRLLEECRSRDDINVIVFTGSGSWFSAGGDIGGFDEKAQMSPLEVKEHIASHAQSLARKVAEIDKPIIGGINGSAVGGGMDIALMCDVRLAAASARFSETYTKLGLIPGVGGTYSLPRLIGTSSALDLFWTCRWVDADQALAIGLVNHVFSDDTFAESVKSYAERVANAAPLSIRFIKRLVYKGLATDLTSHLDSLSGYLALVRTSRDHREALAAFKEKRQPRFTGS
jgi:enoyl-CoA hydratase/carnithine racemase